MTEFPGNIPVFPHPSAESDPFGYEGGRYPQKTGKTRTACRHLLAVQDADRDPSDRQWFIRIRQKEIRDAAHQITWYPEHMFLRMENWIDQMEWDWCISRQRIFATPIPVWFCKKCGGMMVPDEKDFPAIPRSRSQNTLPQMRRDEFPVKRTCSIHGWTRPFPSST